MDGSLLTISSSDRVAQFPDCLVSLTAQTKTKGGILLPESAQSKLNEVLRVAALPAACAHQLLTVSRSRLHQGVVVRAGPGARDSKGNTLPMAVKEGDRVLLPDYGGSKV